MGLLYINTIGHNSIMQISKNGSSMISFIRTLPIAYIAIYFLLFIAIALALLFTFLNVKNDGGERE